MNSFVDPYRDNKTAEQVNMYIKQLAGEDKHRIVHICGTHKDAIKKNGIRSLLPKNVEILMGPGCPVCTVAPNRIDYMRGVPMMRQRSLISRWRPATPYSRGTSAARC